MFMGGCGKDGLSSVLSVWVETLVLQEKLGGEADKDMAGCLFLKSFTTYWTPSR